MRISHTALCLSLAILCGRQALAHGPGPGPEEPRQRVRRVDLVLALDTSSSMNGLIHAARAKMWDVVNLLAKAQPRPELRVGLVSYGNSGYDSGAGWVRVDSDLSSDLDTVYGKLFGLTTGGGDEYVARAVKVATDRMSWAQDQDALRIIFVAGNEAATQDPAVTIDSAVGEARERRIYVNAIFCGHAHAHDAAGWARVASLGGGHYAAIDHNHVVAIATPHDGELHRLSEELNETYVAYGRGGEDARRNQAQQDHNAAATSAPAAAARAAGKASALYRADDWDLVDATRTGKRDVRRMSADELPAELRAVAPEARAAFVADKAKKRAALKAEIQRIAGERERYLAAQRAPAAPPPAGTAPTGAASVDDALLGGLRKEAEASGFKF